MNHNSCSLRPYCFKNHDLISAAVLNPGGTSPINSYPKNTFTFG